MLRSLLFALMTLACLSACSPKPCESCLQVEGTYQEMSTPSQMDCKAWRFLYYDGGHGEISLQQSGDSLRYTGYDKMSGVLHEDGSASFGPTNILFYPITENGEPDPSRGPSPGLLYLHGWFNHSSGRVTGFQGSYVFITDDDLRCEMTSDVVWTK